MSKERTRECVAEIIASGFTEAGRPKALLHRSREQFRPAVRGPRRGLWRFLPSYRISGSQALDRATISDLRVPDI
jgi:hypothetical protein